MPFNGFLYHRSKNTQLVDMLHNTFRATMVPYLKYFWLSKCTKLSNLLLKQHWPEGGFKRLGVYVTKISNLFLWIWSYASMECVH